jgi:molecular chaperone GrpE
VVKQENTAEEVLENEEVIDREAEDVSAENSGDELSELEKARAEAAECNDKLLRLAAEFENYKKRIGREQTTILKYAEEELLKQLLPSLDNLGRAIEQGEKGGDVADLLEGVKMIHKGLLTTLEKFDLQAIDSINQPFDPNFHEALATEENDEVAENHVLLEYEKGYMYKDRLLRAAKVVVSKGSN